MYIRKIEGITTTIARLSWLKHRCPERVVGWFRFVDVLPLRISITSYKDCTTFLQPLIQVVCIKRLSGSIWPAGTIVGKLGGSLSGHSDSNLLVWDLKSVLKAAQLSKVARLSRSEPDCCHALLASAVVAAAMAGTAVVAGTARGGRCVEAVEGMMCKIRISVACQLHTRSPSWWALSRSKSLACFETTDWSHCFRVAVAVAY